MLPTQGLFQSIPCPYYASLGICERAHCLFRHTKADLALSSREVEEEEGIGEREEVKIKMHLEEKKVEDLAPKGKGGETPTKEKNHSEKKSESKSRSHHKSSKEKRHSHKDKKDHHRPSSSSSSSHKHSSHKNHHRSSSKNKEKEEKKKHEAKTVISGSVDSKPTIGLKESLMANQKTEDKGNSGILGILAGPDLEEGEDFSLPDLSDLDEEDPDDIEQQCLKLFEDYTPPVSKEEQIPSLPQPSENPSQNIGKQRQAHPAAEQRRVEPPPIPKAPSNSKTYLQAALATRIQTQRRSYSEVTKTTAASSSSSNKSTNVVPSTSTKKRIAHVPNVTGLLRSSSSGEESKTNANAATRSSQQAHGESRNKNNNGNKTIPRTAAKGGNRVAHSSSVQVKKRPVVNVDTSRGSGKVPPVIRQKVLDQLFDASVQIYKQQEDAFKRAVEEEEAVERRCKTKQVYLSLAVTSVRALRKEAENTKERKEYIPKQQLRQGDWDPPIPKAQALYRGLRKVILTEEQLVENGYPRPNEALGPGRAVAKRSHWDPEYISTSTQRTCDRCLKVFEVSEWGFPIKEETCTYHSGRKTMHRVNRSWETNYSCCGEERGATGCCTVGYHVPKSHPVESVQGFMRAVQPPGNEDTMGNDTWDVVAIDCEMVYTTNGNELGRATICSANDQIIYDSLVKPDHPVLDYNTQYSGLTEEMLRDVTTKLTDVQAVILANLKPNAIICAHSGESDLIALKFIHDYVVDTTILYPHKRGPPYKRGLRNLSADYLNRIIQQSEHGHDSAEDARATLHLAIRFVQLSSSY